MSRRIIFAASAMLFSLVAVVATIMADVHDRTYPESIDAVSSLDLDFSHSGLSDGNAFAAIEGGAGRLGAGLFKVQPDLGGRQRGQDLAALGPWGPKPGTAVARFGDQPPSRIVSGSVLRHSFATGTYLVTGSTTGLDRFVAMLRSQGVQVHREDDSAPQTAAFVLKQGTFRTALLATVTLLASMALFWLSVRSRGRALRVLGGVSTSRIQVQDLGTFLVTLGAAAIPVDLGAVAVVGVRHGWTYVPYYGGCLVAMQVAIVLVTGAIAVLISSLSWPSARLLVRREPPVQSLGRASTIVKAATFLLLVGAAGPAWVALQDASAVASQQARWKSLADQVALRYPVGLGERGFVAIRDRIGQAVARADASGAAALSYAMTPDQLGLSTFGRYDTVAIVNPAWLRLMADRTSRADLARVSARDLPAAVPRALAQSLALWKPAESAPPSLDSFQYRQTGGGPVLPLAEGGSGDLVFAQHALLVVVPKIAAAFGADFLASLTSSSNLVFDGLDPTIALLRQVGLEQSVRVVHVADDGILRAQYTAYTAWLRAIALSVLAAAFVMAAGVSALVSAMLCSRRDFSLRLSGRAWWAILGPRVARECLAGALLTAGLVLVQPLESVAALLLAALAGLVVVPVLHLAATRWCFANVSLRRA